MTFLQTPFRWLGRMARWLVRGGLLGLLIACAPSAQASKAPEDAPQHAPFLWRIQAEQAGPHYLLGSVHMMPRSIYPLPQALEQAFEQSQQLILETDIAALESTDIQQELLRHGLSEQGLLSEIGADLHDRLKRQLAGRGLPAQFCDAFRPWLCALTLEAMNFKLAGMSPEAGIDRHFDHRARQAGKSIDWLETPIEQLSLFFDLDAEQSREFLESALDDLADPALQPKEMVQIWRNNDVQALAEVIRALRQAYPDAHEQLLAARNRKWADVLDTKLRNGPQLFIVVGAGHLVGKDNLRALLGERGFSIEAVQAQQLFATIEQVAADERLP